jgi:Xaa-Pro aminopeptidase
MPAYAIYNTPHKDFNLLHWGYFDAPDAYFALKVGNQTMAFVSELEYDRCCAVGTFDSVFLWSDIRKELKKRFRGGSFWQNFFQFLKDTYEIDRFVVPNDFPAAIYAEISKQVPVVFDASFFEQQRAIKTKAEIAEIRKACTLTTNVLQEAIRILRESTVEEGVLYFEDEILTSERLRAMMEIYCLERGGVADGTIVACGKDGAYPHCVGNGALHADELIVIDVFPYLKTSHFYGDMTRTVVKGHATEAQKKIYQAVLDCQTALLEQLHPGVLTSDLQTFALRFFEERGYGVKHTEKGTEGFIHSVGHGIGLDIHEYPSVGSQPIALKSGMVITVEPGLYFHTVGGVRIEDDVLITNDGCEILTACDKTLKIP